MEGLDRDPGVAEIATSQNMSPFGGSAPALQHCSIPQGADNPTTSSHPSGWSGHAHDTVFFFLLGSQYLILAFLTGGLHQLGLQLVHG